jgi:hypothetical protein
MLTIMTTKNFLNAIDDAYAKGVCAGTMQQKLTDHEDQNRRLNELYRMGYGRGYEDAKCEIGEIDLPVVDDIGEALEEVNE